MRRRIGTVEVWGTTFKGRRPGENQDRVLVDTTIIREGHFWFTGPPPSVIAVADGVGWDPGSEVAATVALETVRGSKAASTDEVLKLLDEADTNIQSAAREAPGKETMCTTIAAVWVHRKSLVWCARGDTPVYLVTDNGAIQVSVPHTGKYGLLTSYLGADAHVTLDSTSLDILTNKAVSSVRAAAIMSDGVSKYISAEVLLHTLADNAMALAEIGKRLMHTASSNGSPDNMSFVMARFRQ